MKVVTNSTDGILYVAWFRTAHRAGWKVGHSTRLHLRMAEHVAFVSEMVLWAVRPAPKREEGIVLRALRDVFCVPSADGGPHGRRRDRYVREWFQDTRGFRDWLSAERWVWRGELPFTRHAPSALLDICMIERAVLHPDAPGPSVGELMDWNAPLHAQRVLERHGLA